MHPIELVLRPATQPGTYWPVLNEKRLTEELLTKATRQPFFDGARELLKRGVDPNTPLISRHEGSQTIALQSTVGEAARWSISERDRGGLSKSPYAPYKPDSRIPRDSSGDDEVSVAPMSDSNGEAVFEATAVGGIRHDTASKIATDFGAAQSDFGRRLVPRYMPPVDPTIEAKDPA